MHSCFLYHAIDAGLDMAIVNAGQITIYEQIPKDLKTSIENVLFNKKDDATDKKQFFQHLSREFVDYQNLRRIQPGSRGVRKSKKIFRNIAREIHSDKLPEGCRGGEMKEMMSTILGKCEKIKDCISQPHTCEEGEL